MRNHGSTAPTAARCSTTDRKPSGTWIYRGHALGQIEWGLWRDLNRPGYYFLCYRPGPRNGRVVRRWAYADGQQLRLQDLQAFVRSVHARRAMIALGMAPIISSGKAREEYLSDLARRNLSKKHMDGVRRTLDRFIESSPGTDMGQVNAGSVERFLVDLTGARLSPRSLNQGRAHLSGWFAWAIRHGYINANPALAVQAARQTIRLPVFPMPEQMETLVRASDRRHAAIWCLLAFTGLRLGSFLALDADSFRDDGILVRQTKRRREWFLDYADGCPLWAADLSEVGHWLWEQRLPPDKDLRAALRDAGKAAGICFTPHGFRHAFCSWLAMSAESLQDIAAWVHHSTAQTTERWYAHLRPRGQERAAANRTAVLAMRSQCMAYALTKPFFR